LIIYEDYIFLYLRHENLNIKNNPKHFIRLANEEQSPKQNKKMKIIAKRSFLSNQDNIQHSLFDARIEFIRNKIAKDKHNFIKKYDSKFVNKMD
jgi:hypothetical protein